MQTIFVSEVDRVGHDSVYWVRREASFAVGALAKVVPLELVLSSLVGKQNTLCSHLIDAFHSYLYTKHSSMTKNGTCATPSSSPFLAFWHE